MPGRTVADLSNDTALRLAEISNIVGIKDATGNMARGTELLMRAPKKFAVYSGDDATTLPLMMLGAHGAISVTANVAPRLMHEMCAAALIGERADNQRAIAINQQLFGLHTQLFLEPNPIPVKWALQEMGLIAGGLRLPLTPFQAQYFPQLRAAMRQAGILDNRAKEAA